MATKKQHEAFNKAFYKLMEKLGAKLTEKLLYKYEIDTKGGVLLLTVHEPSKSDLFGVYCKFTEPEKARSLIGKDSLHPFSGKWNFYYPDADALLRILEIHLNKIILNNNGQN